MKNFFLFGLVVSCALLFPHQTRADIFINEFMTSTSETDEFGTPLEWIELYSDGSRYVDLAGYSLTDDSMSSRKWIIGSLRIPANGFVRIWATGYDLLDPRNFHTNFRLKREGEYLALFDALGMLVDEIRYPEQYRDVSFGRQPNGSDNWRFFSTPSPLASNPMDGIVGFSAPPQFSHLGGIYSDVLEVMLFSENPNAVIRYTKDGGDVSEKSHRYQEPLVIDLTTILRARVFVEDHTPSPTISQTYLFRDAPDLPIISVVTDPENLWDSRTGIYQNAQQHGEQWERPCTIELYGVDGEQWFSEACGIRIHGGASRGRSPKKSFRLYFRSRYGDSKLRYPLMPTSDISEYNQLVLRAGFNDSWGYDKEMQRETAIMISDQVARNLQRDMGHLSCHGIFTELYLNGEYWGLYNITERIEDDFLAEHTAINDWTVVVDSTMRDGDPALWNDFNDTVQNLPIALRNKGIEAIEEIVDLENFTDYIILNVWLQNYDWPHHNWYVARESGDNGKWFFLMWDVEYSFGSGIQGYQINQNTFNNALGGSIIGELFSKAITNQDYRDYFWRRFLQQRNTTLKEEHVLQRLEDLAAVVRPVIPAEAERWGRGKTLADWERAVQLSRDFILQRTPLVMEHITRAIGPQPVAVEQWELF